MSFQPEPLELEAVALSHRDIAASIRFFYSQAVGQRLDPKFIGYSIADVDRERDQRLEELDMNSAFNVLAALEASFQMDFLARCSKRKKDDLSRYFRTVQKKKGKRIALEEDILEGWKTFCPETKSLISLVKTALGYRHWLAHGRYWTPKLGRRYDFSSVYLLAQDVDQELAFYSPE